MKVTITDVAEKAGVSIKTVSRVLNNEPNVAETTRARVKDIAAEMRYSPSIAARGLATSKSYLIALIYDNASPNYLSDLQLGAIDACREAGYHLVVQPLSLKPEWTREEKVKHTRSVLDRLPVDGVILTPPLGDADAVLETLSELNIRHIRISPKVRDQQPYIGMDDESASYQMTLHLLEKGHRRIGFIRGHSDHSATPLRYEGFERAMHEMEVAILGDLVVQGDFTFASGAIAAKELLARPEQERPTAIFASNDDMAAAVISVAGQLGIKVPEGLSVCGFDDTPLASVIWPALTTIRQPIYKMGSQAAKQLVKRSDEAFEVGKILDFEIIVRDSVARAE